MQEKSPTIYGPEYESEYGNGQGDHEDVNELEEDSGVDMITDTADLKGKRPHSGTLDHTTNVGFHLYNLLHRPHKPRQRICAINCSTASQSCCRCESPACPMPSRSGFLASHHITSRAPVSIFRSSCRGRAAIERTPHLLGVVVADMVGAGHDIDGACRFATLGVHGHAGVAERDLCAVSRGVDFDSVMYP